MLTTCLVFKQFYYFLPVEPVWTTAHPTAAQSRFYFLVIVLCIGEISVGRRKKERASDILSCVTADQLAQLVDYRTTVLEVVGSNPGRTTTQDL